jgi:hypothetical protein
VQVTRTIVENGQTRTETLTSKYQPWRAIYNVGSESQIPSSTQATTQEESPVVVEETAPVTTEVAPILVPTPVAETPSQ